MHSGDTTLGGPEKAFPETSLGFAGNADYATLCRRYWKPVYSYLRAAWARSNEDAKDLTQEFFAWMLEERLLPQYRRERGGFRAWLKTLLRRFASHDERDRRRQKRGGGAALFSLDGELPVVPGDSGAADPEKTFERVWFEELVAQAVARVRAREPERFRIYEAYALVSEAPSYADLAARLGVSLGAVEKGLYWVREEIRGEIRRALAGSDGELEDEWKRLLGE